jgi:NRAMP (natural resistance-associated macrophage protein)-like metal ion transporter
LALSLDPALGKFNCLSRPTTKPARPHGSAENHGTSKTSVWRRLGPGLITGASDDDPSGIATYSQAGAGFGFSLLWTMVLCLPLMAGIQEISARIGRISGKGVGANLRRHYSPWFVYPLITLLFLANTINLGSDIGAMGDAVQLLIGGPALLYAVIFSAACVTLEIFGSYPRCASVFKWLTLSLFTYIAAAFAIHVDWKSALRGAVVPSIHFTKDYWSTIIAVFGTTISPYLFFWQASQETEEIKSIPEDQPLKEEPSQAKAQLSRIRFDTWIGMALSEIVGFFIIVSAAATLNAHGVTDIETSSQAAEALRPIAGNFAFFLFAIGIVGTGLLAVPVLAGSAAFAVGEAMNWPTGLERKPKTARGFYGVMTIATAIGLLINFPAVQHLTHLSPIKALFWSAVFNGIAAAPIMIAMMLMTQNRKVLGQFTGISKPLRVMGWLATVVMLFATIGMFVAYFA